MRKIAMAVILLLTISCASTAPVPDEVKTVAASSGGKTPAQRQHVFSADGVAPCVRVNFPAEFKYISRQKADEDGELVYIYSFSMPSRSQYEYSLLKIYDSPSDTEWALVPVSDQYPDEEKLYEIKDREDFPERSAVIIMADKDGYVCLRGVAGEYSSRSMAVFFMIDRKIQKGWLMDFSVEEWLSGKGKTAVNEMKGQLDWFFKNIEAVNCK